MKSAVPSRSRVALGLVASALVVAACSSGQADTDDAEPAASLTRDTPPPTDSDLDRDAGRNPVDTASDSTDGIAGSAGEPSEDKGIVTRAPDAAESVFPVGFATVSVRVTSAEGDECEVCLWLADDDALRQRGLMGVTDLGAAVGMAFRWQEPRTGNFFMFQTPTPLSIAWFDESGSHVGQADMEPCLVDDPATCERYGADAPYTVAIEMFGGQLGAIGISPGSNVELLDLPCV